MSEAEYMAISGEFDDPIYIWDDFELVKNKTWMQRNWQTIKVSDMSTSHIKNTIRMLYRRHAKTVDSWIDVFEAELERRQKEK